MKAFIFTLFLTPVMALADPVGSLVATALEKNPELAAARAKWDAARQQAPQARALEDPMAGVTLERMGTMRPDKVTDAEWMVSQKLPWPGKRAPKIRAATLAAEVTGFEYLEQRRKVQAAVEAAYADLWLARESVRSMAAARDVMTQAEKTVRARYETGAAMQTDVLRLQVELARMSNDVVTMEREVAVAEAALNQQLNAPSTTPRATPTLELPVLPHTLDELLARARQYCCILMARLRAIEGKRAAVEAAKREGWPDVEFRLAARQYNNGLKEFDSGVGINVPWLWRGKYRAMTAEATAEVQMAEADFTAELNMTQLAIREHYTKTETARRQFDLLDQTLLPQTRQLFTATRTNYETGKATMTELLEAQRALRDFELQQARARAEFVKSFARLNQDTAPWDEAAIATGLITPDMK
jgi:outer membrane protein TolC